MSVIDDTKFKRKQSQDNNEITENVYIINKIKTDEEIQQIYSILETHFIFYNLSEQELLNVAKNMQYGTIEQNHYLFQQNDPSTSFMIVNSGSFEVIINGKIKRKLKKGDGFGDLVLINQSNRTSSVRCVEFSSLWLIDKTQFKKAVDDIVIQNFEENLALFEGLDFFNELKDEQKNQTISLLKTQIYYSNQEIITEGEPGSSFYMIKEGSVTVYQNGKIIKKLYEGDSFGKTSLFYNTQRVVTIKSNDVTKCLILSRDYLMSILGDNSFNFVFKNLQKWALENDQIFKNLSQNQITKIINNTNILYYQKEDLIILQDTPQNKTLYIVIDGILKEKKTGVSIAFKDQILGNPFSDQTYNDDIVMQSDGVLCDIQMSQIEELLGKNYTEFLNKDKFQYIIEKSKEQNRQICQQIQTIKDLQFVTKLDRGQFSVVYLVKDVNDDKNYVLKGYDKEIINSNKIQKFLQRERLILQSLNFPFIMQYYLTFKLDYDIFFLQEYVSGYTLYQLIRQIGLLSSYESQFYTANILVILQCLHQNNIIFRDVKPENFIIDSQGYLKATDLGIAKNLKKSINIAITKTFTLIGTPHYAAPEMIQGKGYGCLVDFWQLGVCIFEFLCGTLPFGEDLDDPQQIFDQITKGEFEFPSYFKENQVEDLIRQFLSQNPDDRCPDGYDHIKKHPWFSNLNWVKLMEKDIKVPEISQIPKRHTQLQQQCDFLEQYTKINIAERKLQKRKQYDWELDF